MGNHNYFYLRVQELMFDFRAKIENRIIYIKKKKKCQLYVLIFFFNSFSRGKICLVTETQAVLLKGV